MQKRLRNNFEVIEGVKLKSILTQNDFQIAVLLFRKNFKNLPFNLWTLAQSVLTNLQKSIAEGKKQRIAVLLSLTES